MYYVGEYPRWPVPEASDCWECYNMNVLHSGYCPGLEVDGVLQYANPPRTYKPGGHTFSPFQGGRND